MPVRRQQAMVESQTARVAVPWGSIGTVAGTTLQGLGTGIGQVSQGGASGLFPSAPAPDNTALLVLGGVLLVGVVVWAVRK
jgi:hypothetical protein